MLGKTAGGLYWMCRSLERAENTARLLEAGFRIALTRASDSDSEWRSLITTAGVLPQFEARHDAYDALSVSDFLLRDTENPSSVVTSVENARTNARMVRTALTTEVWEAVNETWMTVREALKGQLRETDLPALLGLIRRQNALVRGALHGTMLRNDIYDFCQIGTAIERFDNTARILDVKYYTLLPSASFVGSSLDNVQWDMILRSLSAHRAFRWLNETELSPAAVAQFLILDRRFPRSLLFSAKIIEQHLNLLADEYGSEVEANGKIAAMRSRLKDRSIESIIEEGLHETLSSLVQDNNAVGLQIEKDYRFYG